MAIKDGIPIDIAQWQGIDYVFPYNTKTVTVGWREVASVGSETITYFISVGNSSAPWSNPLFRKIEQGKSQVQITGLTPGILYYFNVRCEKPSVTHPNEQNTKVMSYRINPATSSEWAGVKNVTSYQVSEESTTTMFESQKTNDMEHLIIQSTAYRITWEPVETLPGQQVVYFVSCSNTNPPGEDAEIVKVYNNLFYETPYLPSGQEYFFNVKCMVVPNRVTEQVVINNNSNVIGISRQS